MPAVRWPFAPTQQDFAMENLGKMLVSVGVLLTVAGLMLWLAADKLGWFGRLPGDIRVEKPGFQFYAPLMTSLVLSIGLTLVLWLFNRFFR
jgi:uncharacterized membrane protein YidH (DUF202 family)